ncbi:MAG: hypothetical protein IPJ82_07305 [Lewinellaceae bacterium]|nr:hypothetical protein [Lewinellaceae bacterium]
MAMGFGAPVAVYFDDHPHVLLVVGNAAGLAFLVLVLAWLHAKGDIHALRWWEFPLLAGALVTAFYFHPLVLYAMLFCSVFFWLGNTAPRGFRALYLLALGILWQSCLSNTRY